MSGRRKSGRSLVSELLGRRLRIIYLMMASITDQLPKLAAEAKIAGFNFKMVASPARRTAGKGTSGGVAIFARKCFNLVELDSLVDKAASEAFPSRLVFAKLQGIVKGGPPQWAF